MREVRGVHLKTRIIHPLQDRCILLAEGGGVSLPMEGHLVGIPIPLITNGNLCQWPKPSVDDREGKKHMILKWIGRFFS